MAILEHLIQETEFAVVDIETTGLSPHTERIVEISVVRVAGTGEPEVLLNTLVDPERPMAGTEIHGITADDIKGAPTFAQVAPLVRSALAGRVLVAHNVYFDYRFIKSQLGEVGAALEVPHLCTMYFGPLLKMLPRTPLIDACAMLGLEVEEKGLHSARVDALAAASLLRRYLHECRTREISTFRELSRLGKYKFLKSFKDPLLVLGPDAVTVAPVVLKTRSFVEVPPAVSDLEALENFNIEVDTAECTIEVTRESTGEIVVQNWFSSAEEAITAAQKLDAAVQPLIESGASVEEVVDAMREFQDRESYGYVARR